jgi:hypothetical protein
VSPHYDNVFVDSDWGSEGILFFQWSRVTSFQFLACLSPLLALDRSFWLWKEGGSFVWVISILFNLTIFINY